MVNKTSKHEITNDDLALMMKKGFDGVDERFAKVDREFSGMRQELKEVKQNYVTKDDLKEEIATKDDFRQVIDILDGIAKDVKDIKNEQTVNIAAHDRMQAEINETRKAVGLKIKSESLA